MPKVRNVRIGALVFPGFELLDLFGPLEMFALLGERADIRLVGEQAGPIGGRGGPRAVVDELTGEGRGYDLLLVPGGLGTRQEVHNPALLDWLRQASKDAVLIASVCTGAALLARAGLLDGRRATTNKRAWQWATAQGPKVDWQAKARWIEDGKFMTSAGISAGIDMSLAAIARLYGEAAAEEVATQAEYEWHRDPGWDPFAELAGVGR